MPGSGLATRRFGAPQANPSPGLPIPAHQPP
jgi:hypothetical protein